MRANGDQEVVASLPKEEALESENYLETILNSIFSSVVVIDEETHEIVDANLRALEIIGAPREHVIGKVCHSFICPAEKGRCPISDLGQTVDKSERVLLRADGERIPILKTVTTAMWRGHKYLIESFIDITEHKKAEKAQQKSEEMFKTMMEEAPIAICNTNLKGGITYVNKRFEEALGYSREEIVGKNGFKLGIMSDETLKSFTKRMKERLMGKPSRLLEGQFKRKDGEWIWAETESRVIKKFGVPVGFQLIARDITERKRAEEERKRFEESLSALNTYGRDLNTAESMEEIYRLTLDAMEKTLGFATAAFIVVEKDMLCVADQRGFPKSFSIKLPLDGTRRGVSVKAARTGRSILVPEAQKEEAWVDFIAGGRSGLDVPIKIGQKVLGVLVVESEKSGAFDEKDQKLLEILASHAATAIENARLIQGLNEAKNQIKEYADQLELKVEQRTRELMAAQNKLLKAERLAVIGEVAAIVGHDLRNPLTGIAGATYYLKTKLEPQMDQKTMEMLKLIEKDIEHSNNIITDLLEYSREIRLELTETNPKFITKEALSLIEFPQNIRVLDLTQSEPKINIDLEKIARVFINIIKNAIDAMPEGGQLTITSNESNGSLEIAFTDTGTGIPKDVLEKIWTPLFTTKAKGMGLGLSICKRFVEAHEGNISVESAVGEGTTFTVTIPSKPKNRRR